MRRRSAVVAGWAARVVRGLWPDRNPLRRTVDRVEAVVVGALAVAFLTGAPLAAVAAGQSAYGNASRAAYIQQAAWHQVRAVLLTSVPALGYGYQATVRAMWTAPGGTRRTGPVPAPPVAQAGATVEVWVDAAGRLTGPPLQSSQVRGQAVLAAAFAPVVIGLAVLCVGQLAHSVLGRRRLAAWDADWQITGPRWTRRR
jgi:hypothetical protein